MAARLLILATVVAPAVFAPAARADAPSEERHLRLYHTHTGERLDLVYWRDNTYVPDALLQLDRFLRDHRTGDVHHVDPHLFDVLFDLTRSIGRPHSEINVVCAPARASWRVNDADGYNFWRGTSAEMAEIGRAAPALSRCG